MDGLECSEVLLSESISATGDSRFDSEYYKKEFILEQSKLNSIENQRFKDCTNFVKKGIFDLSPNNYIDVGVPFIRTTEIKNPLINYNTTVFISKYTNDLNNKTILKPNDLVFTKIGSYIGDVAILTEKYPEYNFSQNVAGASIRDKEKSAYYILFFLSKYGKNQILRSSMLSGQGKLELDEIRNYTVPICSNRIINESQKLISYAYKCKLESERIYLEAEKTLNIYFEIDFDKLNNTGISLKMLKDSYLATGRIDAEYYQVKYDELITQLKSLNSYKLGTDEGICTFKKSIEPGSDYYQDEGISFIRVSNISKFGIQESEIKLPYDVDDNIERLYPKKDTILFSKDGSIGIAYKVDKDLKVITSGALLHLSIKDINKVLPEYLTLVLNSRVVQMQAERDSNGAIIQHWRIDEISNVLIPVAPMEIQIDIKNNINESFRLRKESEELIKKGIRAVEIAIEKSEDEAIKYLESGS